MATNFPTGRLRHQNGADLRLVRTVQVGSKKGGGRTITHVCKQGYQNLYGLLRD